MSTTNNTAAGTGRILVHHLIQSRSERIFWVLEELGIPYDVKVYARTREGKGPKALAEAVPMGKAPAITQDGRIYTESGAIVHHLLQAHASAGTESAASDSSTFWNHFSEGSLMLHLQSAFTVGKVAEGFRSYKALYLLGPFLLGVVAFNRFMQGLEKKNLEPMLRYTEEFLERNENFSGNEKLGEGDFMMIFPLSAIAKTGRAELTLGPHTEAWVKRIQERPAYIKAMERMKAEEEQQVTGPAEE